MPAPLRYLRVAAKRSRERMPQMTKDPVCGMSIEENKAAATVTHQGRTYYFCSESCRSKFLQDPQRYAESGHSGHHG